MATVHEITSVAHKLTTSDGGLWAVLLPSLVASIVPGAAIIVTWLQSRRSAKLAERQLELSGRQLDASNDIQRLQGDMRARELELVAEKQARESRERERELELIAAKQVHDSRGDSYQAWRTLHDAALEAYTNIFNSRPENQFVVYMTAMTEVDDAALRMRFLFGDDVLSPADELVASVSELFTAKIEFNLPYESGSSSPEDRSTRLNAAMSKLLQKDKQVRDAVRAYTVHGLKRERSAQ